MLLGFILLFTLLLSYIIKFSMRNLDIVSLFSGAGGLDLGFKKAGFNIIYANENDKKIWKTFEKNFPNTILNKSDIKQLDIRNIPECVGIIGGPPCQSWSEAGALRGINDERGKLFYNYINVIKEKKPLFFVAENVSGILHNRNIDAFNNIISQFIDIGYHTSYRLLDAKYFNVPQDRKRVFIIGFRKKIAFHFPLPSTNIPTLKTIISDIQHHAKPFCPGNNDISNHEYYDGSFSTIYMSRNRVRAWHEPSFTIQAGGRHAPIHPNAPKMELVAKDKRVFKEGYEHLYRRLTVRECARIQTFPDYYIFYYNNILDGYKMIGNAVPVNLSYEIAKKIMRVIS